MAGTNNFFVLDAVMSLTVKLLAKIVNMTSVFRIFFIRHAAITRIFVSALVQRAYTMVRFLLLLLQAAFCGKAQAFYLPGVNPQSFDEGQQ